MNALALCPVCQRHIRSTDSRCPFCNSPARSASLAVIAAAGIALSGCLPTGVYGPAPAPAYGPAPITKQCSDSTVLITMDWPPSDRADLEAIAHSGPAILHRAGCDVAVLRNCRAPGSYRYESVSADKSETLVHGTDELFRLLPTRGDRFASFAQKPEGLRLTAVTVGRRKLDAVPAREALQGECDRATHVVTEIRVGAFEVASGPQKLEVEGDPSACGTSEPGATAPPEKCRELLRLELAPLSQKQSER